MKCFETYKDKQPTLGMAKQLYLHLHGGLVSTQSDAPRLSNPHEKSKQSLILNLAIDLFFSENSLPFSTHFLSALTLKTYGLFYITNLRKDTHFLIAVR